jgi:SAM-dependent methyltransferase
MNRRWWVVPAAGIAGFLLYRRLRRGGLLPSMGRHGGGEMPSPAFYDTVNSAMLPGMYDRVTRDVISACPGGRVLDVGCGPGRLDVRLGEMAPSLDVTGVDIDPAMVSRAAVHATDAGVLGRVLFEVGSAGDLPFPEGRFDLVISTLSLHHWPDPVRGLAEIHRVLKPGAEALIYDVPDVIRHFVHSNAMESPSLSDMARESPFGGGTVEAFRWPGPLPLLRRLRLQKAATPGEHRPNMP